MTTTAPDEPDEPESDHLARLFREGDSAGVYVPVRFNLHLRGTDQVRDHMVYLHEVHHSMLNDATSWGSLLHLYARLPAPYRSLFPTLLDDCRETQESFATYAGGQTAAARHGDIGTTLAFYPEYVGLYATLTDALSLVEGDNRRYLAATAMARACMQTPAIDVFTEIGPDRFRLSDVRLIDRPDTRWRMLLAKGPGLLAAAAHEADIRTREAHGAGALGADGEDSDLYAATSGEHDDAWETWERAAYTCLCETLTASGARTLAFNGHQEMTGSAVARAREIHPGLRLRPSLPDDLRQDDAALAGTVLQQVRHHFAGRPWEARLVEVPFAELAATVSETSRIEGQPFLVVYARLTTRMAELYRWPPGIAELLSATRRPLAAVRVIAESERPDGDNLIVHVPLVETGELDTLAEIWGDRGPLLVCVAASCLIDVDWQRTWMSRFLAVGPLVVVIDLEPEQFVPRWVSQDVDVVASQVEISDTAGARTALLLSPDGFRTLWLAIANDITVNLLTQQVRSMLGSRFREDAAGFEERRDTIMTISTSLLATESFIDFNGLDGHP